MTTTRRSFSEVRQWVWNRGTSSARPGIMILGFGKEKHRLFIDNKEDAEQLVHEVIELLEAPNTWGQP